MSKNTTKKALHSYLEKQLKKERTPRRKNQKPEKLVEKDCMAWFKNHGFDMSVVEAKSTYSQNSGFYSGSPVEPGFTDCVGNDKEGRACYVEFKAKGRRSTVREKQRRFLYRKIKSNCFAVVVDCTTLLDEYYNCWRGLYNDGHHQRARDYLMQVMPGKKQTDMDTPLF